MASSRARTRIVPVGSFVSLRSELVAGSTFVVVSCDLPRSLFRAIRVQSLRRLAFEIVLGQIRDRSGFAQTKGIEKRHTKRRNTLANVKNADINIAKLF